MKIVARNKRARRDYDLGERLEAGLVLTGSEVKALRMGRANITDGYVRIKDGEAWLMGCQIQRYPYATHVSHDPGRPRKLLLHKRQIRKLAGKVSQQGMTIIPLALYFNDRGLAKVELAVAKGRKIHDKREAIRRRQQQREMARALKR